MDIAGNGENPSDAFCLHDPTSVSLSDSTDRLWALQRHFSLCDWDPVAMNAVLDELIKRGEPAASYEKAVYLMNTQAGSRDQIDALLATAANAGHEPSQKLLRGEALTVEDLEAD